MAENHPPTAKVKSYRKNRLRAILASAALIVAICGLVLARTGLVRVDDGFGQPGQSPAGVDDDQDSLSDALEDSLAERFAPIVFHGETEPNLPVNVDWWLSKTNLAAHGTGQASAIVMRGPLKQSDLLSKSVQTSEGALVSDKTRSRLKLRTFFLEDLQVPYRSGLMVAPAEWVTYVHSYPNDLGGVTLQYWRAYVWNSARFLFVDVGHGGDWEGISVVLDAAHTPARVAFLGHNGIGYEERRVQWKGSHPLVWVENGSHASLPESPEPGRRWIAQETWTGGSVTWSTGDIRGNSGGLTNVGERTRPRNGQYFIQYSGLWAAPHQFFFTSGYWGPAFNETDATCTDGRPAYGPTFAPRALRADCGKIRMKAWCDGIDVRKIDTAVECFAESESP
jgi:hypothetical protein